MEKAQRGGLVEVAVVPHRVQIHRPVFADPFDAERRADDELVEREEFVPVVHDGASLIERFSTSKIVQEIGQLLAPLDPEAEEAVVTLIRSLGDAAAKIKALTAPPPPADNPEPPAQP